MQESVRLLEFSLATACRAWVIRSEESSTTSDLQGLTVKTLRTVLVCNARVRQELTSLAVVYSYRGRTEVGFEETVRAIGGDVVRHDRSQRLGLRVAEEAHASTVQMDQRLRRTQRRTLRR